STSPERPMPEPRESLPSSPAPAHPPEAPSPTRTDAPDPNITFNPEPASTIPVQPEGLDSCRTVPPKSEVDPGSARPAPATPPDELDPWRTVPPPPELTPPVPAVGPAGEVAGEDTRMYALPRVVPGAAAALVPVPVGR